MIEFRRARSGRNLPRPSRTFGYRVEPAQRRKAGEVGICAGQLRAIFEREGSEVSIRREIPRDANALEETEQEIGVPFTRRYNLNGILIQPILYDRNPVMSRKRPLQNTPACHNPDESQYRSPGQTDRFQLTIESLFPPPGTVENPHCTRG